MILEGKRGGEVADRLYSLTLLVEHLYDRVFYHWACRALTWGGQ
jgi:hypothetical protein